MRKNLLICDACLREIEGHVAFHLTIGPNDNVLAGVTSHTYDFCSLRCLDNWARKDKEKNNIKEREWKDG